MSKYDIPPQFEYQNRIINVTNCHGEGKKHLELQNGFFKKITDFPRVVPHFFFQKLNMSGHNTIFGPISNVKIRYLARF